MAGVSGDGAYFTLERAARVLGVSPNTVNRWANDGRISCALTPGGHRRFAADVIAALASANGPETGQEPDDHL